MSQHLEQLRQLLAEVFQLDQAELDFGIYRIMNAKREEIVRFLDRDLLPQTKGAIQASGAECPGTEEEVYSHLYSFFRRYYQEGDFISLRRYKEGVYAIPYEGEEVKLHWANHDQYYIKTTEYLRDYTFNLPSGRRVHFKIVDVDTDKDIIRADIGKQRRFTLSQLQPLVEVNDELFVRFNFLPNKAKQSTLNALAVDRILNQGTGFECWRREFASLRPTPKYANRTLLEKHIADYTARNTFDYFIHKDLDGFLRRELDFYIKNEVMHLDDIESDSAPRVEQYISKIKAIRMIAHKIIDFLAQIENFQKMLWLKKKFVVETQYCLTLDKVPEELYPEIAVNDDQRKEWVNLFAINEIEGDINSPGYTEPLSIDFLNFHQHLVVDTRHFDDVFKTMLLSKFENLDDNIDGLLIQSENFQAINLLTERYRNSISCLYIDPPYNTGDSDILYKNEYVSASWLSLIENRLALATRTVLSDDPVIFIAIDDFEMVDLCELVDTHFPSLRREMIVVNHHPQGGKAKALASTHEYMLACVSRASDRTFCGRQSKEGVEQRAFKRAGTAESNFRKSRWKSFYAILIDPATGEVVGAEPPPALNSNYPTGPTKGGFIRVYPLGNLGEERVWRRTYKSGLPLISRKKLICTENNTIYQLIEANERTPALFSNWISPRYNAGTFGANLLGGIIGEHNPFSYPKSIHTVEDAIFSAGLDESAICLDFFAGSGTTGHAVINLNRSDGDNRKYILVEMEDYFDTVLVPRIKKIIYSKDWKDGKPVSRVGTSHMFKCIRLESYEDTLNNLQIVRSESQQALLDQHTGFREDYFLRYMLNIECRDSPSLLNVEQFNDPFNFTLNIATGTVGETIPRVVDLVESFNYLLGIRVKSIDDVSGVRVVSGTSPQGEQVLILWRKILELDNNDLGIWFCKHGYNKDKQLHDVIYVNGDNNLESHRKHNQSWRVQLIEREFRRLMFDAQDV